MQIKWLWERTCEFLLTDPPGYRSVMWGFSVSKRRGTVFSEQITTRRYVWPCALFNMGLGVSSIWSSTLWTPQLVSRELIDIYCSPGVRGVVLGCVGWGGGGVRAAGIWGMFWIVISSTGDWRAGRHAVRALICVFNIPCIFFCRAFDCVSSHLTFYNHQLLYLIFLKHVIIFWTYDPVGALSFVCMYFQI